MIHLCLLPLLLLRFALIASAHQLLRRQTGVSRSPSITSAATINSQPCCWIYPGVAAVKVNSWYTSVVTQYTATVITTFIQYNNTLLTLNSSTAYAASQDVFTDFSYYGCYGTPITVPGVPTTLIDAFLLDDHGEYGATTVVRSNETIITFDYTDLAIPSPTPYLSFPQVRVYTTYPEDTRTPGVSYPASQAPYDAELCGTSSQISYLTWSSNAWSYVTKTEYMPLGYGFGPGDLLHLYDYEYCYDGPSDFAFAMAIPAPMPNEGVYVSLPDSISASIVANKTLLSMSPWLTNCFTMGAQGEPTVHIQVQQLTSQSSITLTTRAVLAAKTSAAVSLPAETERAQTAATPAQSPENVVPATQTSQSPETIPVQTKSRTAGSAASTTVVLDGVVTLASTTAPFQLQDSAVVVAGTTLTVGGAPITVNGQTLTLVTQPGGVALVIDGSSTRTLSASPVAQRVVTLGAQTLTIAAQSDATFVNGVKLSSGAVTSISGVAVSLSGTDVVLGGQGTTLTLGLTARPGSLPGSSSPTQGLGGAIISGLGGGSGNTTAPYRGAAGAGPPQVSCPLVWLAFSVCGALVLIL